MAKPRPDRVTRELEKQREEDLAAPLPAPLLPSPRAATNIIIADIVVRSAARLFSKNVQRKVAEASLEAEEEAEANGTDPQDLLDGRGMITTLGLYGASRLATKSPAGLGIVLGGLALKTLYDRGRDRQRRLHRASLIKGDNS